MSHRDDTPAEDLVRFAANEILAYLQARPAAADTLEGIHRWWIRWPGPEESLAVSEAALKRLEASGEMRQAQVGSRLLWRKSGEG